MEFKDSKDFSLLFFVWAFIKNLEKIIEKRFCTKCWGNNNKLWFSRVSVGHWNLANAKLSSKKQKSLLNFFKNCGFGQRP
ncbi:hypothetical protein [Ruminococcus sp.]